MVAGCWVMVAIPPDSYRDSPVSWLLRVLGELCTRSIHSERLETHLIMDHIRHLSAGHHYSSGLLSFLNLSHSSSSLLAPPHSSSLLFTPPIFTSVLPTRPQPSSALLSWNSMRHLLLSQVLVRHHGRFLKRKVLWRREDRGQGTCL